MKNLQQIVFVLVVAGKKEGENSEVKDDGWRRTGAGATGQR
jgi:hypothetical protein